MVLSIPYPRGISDRQKGPTFAILVRRSHSCFLSRNAKGEGFMAKPPGNWKRQQRPRRHKAIEGVRIRAGTEAMYTSEAYPV